MTNRTIGIPVTFEAEVVEVEGRPIRVDLVIHCGAGEHMATRKIEGVDTLSPVEQERGRGAFPEGIAVVALYQMFTRCAALGEWQP
jgi:hypothetical protein